MRRIREALGLSQRQFAERLGVHQVTVAKWETDAQGMRGPAERLIRLLGESAGAVEQAKRPARPRKKRNRKQNKGTRTKR